MSFNLTHIWTHMGPLSKAIAFVLFMMAVSFIGVTIAEDDDPGPQPGVTFCNPLCMVYACKPPARQVR